MPDSAECGGDSFTKTLLDQYSVCTEEIQELEDRLKNIRDLQSHFAGILKIKGVETGRSVCAVPTPGRKDRSQEILRVLSGGREMRASEILDIGSFGSFTDGGIGKALVRLEELGQVTSRKDGIARYWKVA